MQVDTFAYGTKQRIGFVTPRYGIEVVGGAERLVRGTAEQLAARGYAVEAFATCVLNIHEWRDHYPPGDEMVNGVLVHRFPLDPVDLGQLQRTTQKAMAGERVAYSEQLQFVQQSVNSQPLFHSLRERQNDFACFIFAPYMFGTTYWGVKVVPDKAILLPCLHNEPYAHFIIYRELIEEVRGVIFNAEAERRFAMNGMGMVNPHTAVVGYGFEPPPVGNSEHFRRQRNLPSQFILYSGRLESGKNVPLLIDYFTRYKTERPSDLALVFTNDRGDVTPPPRSDIVSLGFLSEEDLHNAYAAATTLCQPSVNESFSIVMMEAWLQHTPALVHTDCAVTSDHVRQSGGGWTFRTYEEFRAALDQILGDPDESRRRAQAGCAYVQQQYNWDAVIERLVNALKRFMQPRSLAEQLAQNGIRHALDFSRERFDDQFTRVIERAEADLAQGLTHDQIGALRQAARIAMPDYQVQSNIPVIGKFIAWLRRHLTSHLREPYIDPIISRQEVYNTHMLNTLLPALERSLREQRRLSREIELLRKQLAHTPQRSDD